MFWLRHQFAHHRLDDADIAVQKPTECPSEKREPHIRREPHHNHAEECSKAPKQQNGLSADSVRQGSPVHASEGFSEGEGRDQEARVEGRIFFLSNLVPFYKGPGVWKDGSQGDGFGEADDS